MTPAQALDAGANYIVVGRPVTAASDPVAAWTNFSAVPGTIEGSMFYDTRRNIKAFSDTGVLKTGHFY